VGSFDLNAAGYVRVSTEEQVQGYSPEAQKRSIERCCTGQGWDLVKLYMDLGVSGAKPPTKEARPQLWSMIRDAKKGIFEVALVVNFDRISRDTADAGWIRKEFEINGVRMAETSSPDLDSRTPTGKAMYGMKAVFAELERELIRERTKRGMAEGKEQGKHMGRPPAGFAIGEGGRLVLDNRGVKVLSLLKRNPKVNAQILQKALEIKKYKDAWTLLRSVKAHAGDPSATPQIEAVPPVSTGPQPPST